MKTYTMPKILSFFSKNSLMQVFNTIKQILLNSNSMEQCYLINRQKTFSFKDLSFEIFGFVRGCVGVHQYKGNHDVAVE